MNDINVNIGILMSRFLQGMSSDKEEVRTKKAHGAAGKIALPPPLLLGRVVLCCNYRHSIFDKRQSCIYQ